MNAVCIFVGNVLVVITGWNVIVSVKWILNPNLLVAGFKSGGKNH